MKLLIVIFPIVFLVHELEEVMMFPYWKKHILPRFSHHKGNVTNKVLQIMNTHNTTKFILIIAEELIIVLFVVFYSYQHNLYDLFGALVIAYFVHLMMHLVHALILKSYTPMLVTSIITSIYCLIVFREMMSIDYDFSSLVIYSVLLIMFMFGNLMILHLILNKILHINIKP